eukprot:TRINITY_DN4006_c0_g2_i9.p1 TRINITY_DN4006_c0_g2~~TRINITY_DN4006_c0_g2_i9.p1  ORF type:complete len:460 (+),score=63.28 TRINITY_DN4006_c0_g2_i9:30-1409(+)
MNQEHSRRAKMSFVCIIALATILSGVNAAKLSIWNPPQLARQFPVSSIPNVVVGHAPAHMVNKSLIVEVFPADPIDACTPLNPLPLKAHNTNPFVFIEMTSGCRLIQMIRHAINIGAQGIIIMDKYDDVTNEKERKHFSENIPVLYIGKQDGAIFKSFLLSKDPKRNEITLRITFEVVGNSNSWEFWITPENPIVYDFADEIQKNIQLTTLAEHINIIPRFEIHPLRADAQSTEHCLFEGRYCFYPNTKKWDGKVLLLQSVYMKCLWVLNAKKFIPFLLNYKEKCQSIDIHTPECLKESASKESYDLDALDSCYQRSNHTLDEQIDNYILREEQDRYKFMSASNNFGVPMLFEKSRQLSIHAHREIKKSVCNGLETSGYKDPACQLGPNISGIPQIWIYFIIICPAICFAFLIFRYFRRRARSELTEELNTQIQTAISQYYIMSQEKTKEKQSSYTSKN